MHHILTMARSAFLLPFSITLIVLSVATGHGFAREAELEEMSLEDLTTMGLSNPPKTVTASTAAKMTQTVADAPSVVRIVTAEEIKTYGYRTLDDILRSLPGLYTTSDGLNTYLGVRGFGRPGDYNTRILILIDGVRINDNVFDSALVGREFPVDVDLIERLEYAPGPGSAVYGNNAFFGVINVITKNGNWYDGVQLSVGGGSFDTRKFRLSYGKRFDNGAELLLSATDFQNSDVYPYFPDEISSSDSDRDQDRSFLGKFSFGSFKTEIVYGQRKSELLVPPFSGLRNEYDEIEDKKLFIDTRYSKNVGKNWIFDISGSYNKASYSGKFPFLDDDLRIVDNESDSGSWLSGELRMTNTSLHDHRILLGVEGHQDLELESKAYEEGSEPYFSMEDKFSRFGIFLQDDITLTDTFTLLIGARYDDMELGNRINPRIGLIWQPQDETTLKLLYGSAFRTANFFEASTNEDAASFAEDVTITVPQLETIKTGEVALEHYLTPSTRLSGSLYYYRLDDIIEESFAEDTSFSFQNGESIDAYGFELTAEQRFTNGSIVDVNYALQKTEDFADQRLSNSPAHQLKIRSSLPLWFEHGRVGLEAQYTSERTTEDGTTLDDFWLANATFTYKATSYLDISASIYNIGDTDYSDPARALIEAVDGIEQEGRSFYIQLDFNF